MKYLLYFSVLLYALTSCEPEAVAPPIHPSVAASSSSTSTLIDLSASPLSDDLKQFCYEFFPSPAVQYDTESEMVVLEGDILFSLETLQRYQDSIAAYAATLPPGKPGEEGLKHRMVDYRWASVSKNHSNIRVYVPQLTHPNLTPAEETQFRNKVIDGFLSWNNAPNSRIQVSIVNYIVEQFDIEVDWVDNAIWRNYGQGEFPDGSGKPGRLIRINTGIYAQHINRGDDVLGTTINNNIEATAAHELGHNLGMMHVDTDEGQFAFETEVDPAESVIYTAWSDPNSSPQVSMEDLDALSVIYPDAFPRPTVYASVDYGYLMLTGNYRLNLYFVQPNGTRFPKMKVYVRNEQTGVTTKLREASWIDTLTYDIPGGGVAGQQYRISVQTINWRHDVGSAFQRLVVTLP